MRPLRGRITLAAACVGSFNRGSARGQIRSRIWQLVTPGGVRVAAESQVVRAPCLGLAYSRRAGREQLHSADAVGPGMSRAPGAELRSHAGFCVFTVWLRGHYCALSALYVCPVIPGSRPERSPAAPEVTTASHLRPRVRTLPKLVTSAGCNFQQQHAQPSTATCSLNHQHSCLQCV